MITKEDLQLDEAFFSFLQTLSCFQNLSSYQVSQLLSLLNPIPFQKHEYCLNIGFM